MYLAQFLGAVLFIHFIPNHDKLWTFECGIQTTIWKVWIPDLTVFNHLYIGLVWNSDCDCILKFWTEKAWHQTQLRQFKMHRCFLELISISRSNHIIVTLKRANISKIPWLFRYTDEQFLRMLFLMRVGIFFQSSRFVDLKSNSALLSNESHNLLKSVFPSNNVK